MTTISLSNIEDLEVVTISDAEVVGTVETVVLDRSARAVQRVRVGGSKRSPEMVDWRDIAAVGPDVVTLGAADAVHPSRDDEDELYVRGDVTIIGARVLDDAGFEHGSVKDLHFDDETGDTVAFLTDAGRIPVDDVHSLGGHALVVRARALSDR